MAVNNSLTEIKKVEAVCYMAGDENIKLSSDVVKRYFVSSGSDSVTDQEVYMFMKLCEFQHLNPFLKDAYLVKYKGSPAQIITSKSAYEKKAFKNPAYKGFKAGIYVVTASNELEKRDGMLYLQGEQIVGGWCDVYIDGYEKPISSAVSLSEYKQNTHIWNSKPATMIRKVAKVQALREAFPEDLQGLYTSEEIAEADVIEPAESENSNENFEDLMGGTVSD